MKNPEVEVMAKFLQLIADSIQKYGMSIVLLGAMVYYFHNQNKVFQSKIDNCNEQIMTIYQKQNQKLIEVVDKNAEAFKCFTDYIDKIKEN